MIALIVFGHGLIGLLVSLLVLCLIAALVWWVFSLIPLPAVPKQIVMVILAIIFVLILIGLLLGGFGVVGGGAYVSCLV